jgi:hypothetical protein
MIVAMWAVFVALLKLLGILSKALLALLAGKRLATISGGSSSKGAKVDVYHISLLQQFVICLLAMALGTVEPFPAYGGSAFAGATSLSGRCIQQGDRIETCAFRMCLLAHTSACRVQN